MLQLAEVKDTSAAEHQADDEIEQDTMYGENGITRFFVGEISYDLNELDFFEVTQKNFNATESPWGFRSGGRSSLILFH